jgi:hypothetical protein
MVVSSSVNEILTRAVVEKAAMQLALMIDGQRHTLTTRPVRVLDDGTDGFWAHVGETPRDLLEEIAKQLPECEANFVVRRVRYQFATAVLKRDKHFWLNDQMMLDAILLRAPEQLSQVQERRSARHPVSDGSGVSADLFRYTPRWQGGELKQHPTPVKAKLRDLSLHGAGFICAFDRQLAELKPGDRIGCVVNFNGTKTPLLGTLRQVRTVSSRAIHLGVSFNPPANAADREAGIQSIAPIVQELERQETMRQQMRGAGTGAS